MVQSPWRNRRPGRRQQKASTPVHDCHVYAVVGSRTWICDSGSVHGVGFSDAPGIVGPPDLHC